MMAYLTRRYALIDFGLFLIMALGSDGDITTPPSNKAVLTGTSRVNMSCTTNAQFNTISWNFMPVGGSFTQIGAGSQVAETQRPFYVAEQSGSQSNLIILNATAARAGTYICGDLTGQQAYGQLIVISSDPVCSANASTEVLWNESVQMSCNISFTANTSYVNVNMSWSKGDPATIVSSGPPVISGSPTLTTAVSTISQIAGYVTPFPMYSCTTSLTAAGNLPSSANTNAPDYSKSTPVFSSPPNVIYLKPADADSIKGAKDGEKVYLGTNVTCSVEGNPAANYSWWDVESKNTTYSPNIQIWHSGEYICRASNRAGNTTFSINVTTYITTAAPTTSTIPTTTGPSSRSTSPNGSGSGGGLSDRDKIIVGVVVGVGGALVIAAVAILIYCCMKKKSKTEKYSGGSDGTLSKPPPYDERDGHRGPQPSSNPDIIRQAGYPMDDFPKRYTAGVPDTPYIVDDGLTYSEMQLDNNPRSRQPLKPAEQSNYVDVGFA